MMFPFLEKLFIDDVKCLEKERKQVLEIEKQIIKASK